VFWEMNVGDYLDSFAIVPTALFAHWSRSMILASDVSDSGLNFLMGP
jgi:hypothetical protein